MYLALYCCIIVTWLTCFSEYHEAIIRFYIHIHKYSIGGISDCPVFYFVMCMYNLMMDFW